MRASKVTQYGIPTAEGGLACELKIDGVRVFLTGEDSERIRYVAESLRSYWNADEPDENEPRSDFAGVATVCERIVGGAPMVYGEFSVGPWTPAVPDGFDWAVLDKTGAPLLLAHDAFEAARHFCRLVEGSATTDDNVGGPYRLAPDAKLAELDQTERCVNRGWL
jgi:hypothetical protein